MFFKKNKTRYFVYAENNLGKTFSMITELEDRENDLDKIKEKCEQHFGDKRFTIKLINKL